MKTNCQRSRNDSHRLYIYVISQTSALSRIFQAYHSYKEVCPSKFQDQRQEAPALERQLLAFISTNFVPFFLIVLNRGEQTLIKQGFISFYPNESQDMVIFFLRFFFHLMKTLSPSFQSHFTKEHSRDIKVSLNEEVFLKLINNKRTMKRDPLILSQSKAFNFCFNLLDEQDSCSDIPHLRNTLSLNFKHFIILLRYACMCI